jgi:hypothetical protein
MKNNCLQRQWMYRPYYNKNAFLLAVLLTSTLRDIQN